MLLHNRKQQKFRKHITVCAEKTEYIDKRRKKNYNVGSSNLFCLDLSFIGWYIVGSICLGVGILFVMPYHETARAEFYEELQGQNATPDFGKVEM